MIDFLWGLAGCLVAAVVVGVLLNRVLASVTDSATLAPSTSDKVIGFVIGLGTMMALTSLTQALVSDPSPFVDQLSLGAGLSVVFGAPEFLALGRGHRDDRPSIPAQDSPRPPQRVPAATFPPAVHSRFADPVVRARYVIAAYRRGLIPPEDVPGLAADLAPLLPDGAPAWAELAAHEGGAGLDGTVDRAAREIGYARSPEEERADVVERLVYAAMCSTDPMVRLATVALLAPPVTTRDPELLESDVRWRMESRRAAIEADFAVRYDGLLTPGVERRFRDPTVRAHELIAGYRRGVIFSADVPQLAADIVADLPAAGEAWTELAMASATEPRAELLPILDRAAREIGYHRDDEQAEADLLESAAYRAIVTGEVMAESRRLHRLDDHDYVIDYDHRFEQAPELEALRDAQYICGDYYFEQIASVRADLARYLAARYP
ncbi:hypothetical protein ACXYTP_05410 [Tsukamurella ocularis]|uniref:hypothetical protein n=1 Tax=Tsukamurella ocularis TaxID=1970234 RepID=UPI0039F0580E